MLNQKDLDLLRLVLRRARAIEQDSQALENADRIRELQDLIHSCEAAESLDLRRLSKWADHLQVGMSLRHYYGILVPFERLSQKALRDDEFIIDEKDAVPGASRESGSLIAILDNLRSAFNVGAIFRTAEAMGAKEIRLCGYTPGPDDEKTTKTAMGTASLIPWRRFSRLEEACAELKEDGYIIAALETAQNSEALGTTALPEKTAFLLGNERFGLDPGALSIADRICRIPLRGTKNSLNVGIAFGIAAFEYERQQKVKPNV